MTHTITLVADHKGLTRPSVMGDESVVVGDMATTDYRIGSPANSAIKITAVASGGTFTRASGNYITDGFVAGDYCTIVGSHANNDSILIEISTLTATVLAATGSGTITADDHASTEVFTHAGEKILASDFGLTTMTHLEILGGDKITERYQLSNMRDNGKHCYLYAFNTNADNNSTLLGASLVGAANANAGDTVLGTVRLRAFGSI